MVFVRLQEWTVNDMRLIDADALKEFYGKWSNKHTEFLKPEVDIYIDRQPTIDAVPVVRCRECKYWKHSGSKAGNSFSDMEYIGGCEFTKYYRRESDFCSYGERKDGE